MAWYEVNFDGLVGPSHHYGGLSFGNIPSIDNKQMISKPKQAALQGLAKMKLCTELGLKQAILPPHPRPCLKFLKQLGYKGSNEHVLNEVRKNNPELLAAAYSASSMWTANAATVSPSPDTKDQRIHFTPANLISNLHRALETDTTASLLKTIFHDPDYFFHHPALPKLNQFADEGSANHMRFCQDYGEPGVELFIYGKHSMTSDPEQPIKYPARQSYEASHAIARLHRLQALKTIYAQQQAAAIDYGVFHNDVVAVGNKNVLLYHELSYVNGTAIIEQLQHAMDPTPMFALKVPNAAVPLEQAVTSYLFNSQLVSLNETDMALIAPLEVEATPATNTYVQQLLADKQHPINAVHYIDCRQSMRNGGGPACLRLRVVMNDEQIAAIRPNVLLTDELHQQLTTWVNKHYRDELSLHDLLDPMLIEEGYQALNELTKILQLGHVYDFQR